MNQRQKKKQAVTQLKPVQQAKPKADIRTRADAIDYLVRLSRSDGWQNETSGFGTETSDPIANTFFSSITTLSDGQLEALYRDDWVARKIVDAPAEDMTRLPVDFIYDEEPEEKKEKSDDMKVKEPEVVEKAKAVEDIEERLNDLDWMPLMYEQTCLSRLYGGSLMVFFFDDPDELSDPLNEHMVKGIKRIEIVNKSHIYPESWYPADDEEKPRQVEHYRVELLGQREVEVVHVHESRCIRMDGRMVPVRQKMQNYGWNDSFLQNVHTAVRQHQVSSSSAASTMENFITKLLKVENLVELVTENEDDTIIQRIQLAAANMTVHKIALCGANEELSFQGTPVSGLADLWDRFSEIIAAAADIPRSRFFSSQSGALGGNAAESDLRNYYDRISLQQERRLRPAMERFILFVSYADGFDPDTLQFKFKPLWMPSDKERLEVRYMQAQTDQIYIQEGVVLPEEVTNSRFSKKEIDLDSMMIDADHREEQQAIEDEAAEKQAEEDKLRFEAMANGDPNAQPFGNEDPKEKKDSLFELVFDE